MGSRRQYTIGVSSLLISVAIFLLVLVYISKQPLTGCLLGLASAILFFLAYEMRTYKIRALYYLLAWV